MKGRAISYSSAELRFIKAGRAMKRRALHAAFVEKFGRGDVTPGHIKTICTRRGWTTGRNERWSPQDDALLRQLYPDTPTEDVARRLGRTLTSTYGHAMKLGLEKSEAYLASPAACRLRRGDNVGAAHRFRQGHAPANKGMRRPGWTAGRMSETQFKKGQRGNRFQPIGSTRLVDGYRYTKISATPNVPWTRNWKCTHIIEWEKLNGPLPKGMILKCLDGNRLNTDPSNWEQLSRALLPRLNGKSGRNYDGAPSELKPAIMAIAKLEHAARNRSAREREA
ncbi:MAG: endonuclease [Gemmatimonadetes bacterium]|nr:endonuclease [Gemmatimonadota bacterium]